MMRTQSKYCLFLAAFFIGIIFSVSWLYPLSVQAGSKGKFSFVHIRYGPHTQDDNYFYYAHIREVIDGHFLSGDPATFENKNKLSPHVSYSFSLLMCSLGGLISKNTAHAYYFNYFIYPALNFLVIYYLLLLITNSKYLSVFSSLLIIFMLIILLFLICEKKVRSLFKDMSLIFCLGISPLVSAQNFFVSYAVYCFVTLMYLKEKALRKRLLVCFFISLIISSTGIFLIIKAYPVFIKVMSDFFTMPGFIFSGISINFLIAGL